MNVFLGQALILAGLFAATFGSVTGIVAGVRHSAAGRRWTEWAAHGFAFCMIAANLTMIRALLQHDFSVSYVAQVGSRASPTWISVVSLWSSLEGSILFWTAILALYVLAFTRRNRLRFADHMPYALGVLLAVASFFAFLVSGPANPFRAMSPVPPDGPGPNPLLQNHILMSIHPPMLYCGYVGMSVPFAIAVAALLRGQLSAGWLKVLRRWTMAPWLFLGVGIVLGGWWAYEVLGWGGYWAWDPVENASFLPWLAATAYLHTTLIQERRRMLKAWTLGLVLAAFMLTILGTFMTRSGIFNSVHAFTQSSIGPLFLGFLALVLLFSLGLLAGRAHLLQNEGRVEALLSRETAFIVNNLLLVVFTFTVLLGTVFPLITEALRGAKLSVGEPYFDRMAVPIGMMLVFLMGVGPTLPWGKPRAAALAKDFFLPCAAGALTVALCLALGLRATMPIATFGLCTFAGWVTLREMVVPALARKRRHGDEGWLAAALHSIRGARRRFGGYVVHLGVIVIAAAIAASGAYKRSAEASLTPGEAVHLGAYTFVFNGTSMQQQAHVTSIVANVSLVKKGHTLATLEPKLNHYRTQREPIGTPHVVTSGIDDVYLSLLSVEPDGQRIGLKVFVIPLVAWIWWSLPLIIAGSLISLWPKRAATQTVPTGATAGAL